MIEIDKNVPPPQGHHARGKPKKYPFEDMEVGDSFLAENDAVVSAAAQFKRRHAPDFEFASRKEGGKRRIWRVK